MTERVFVYGTLRKGMFYHADHMHNAEFETTATVSGFVMYKNREDYYPYIIRGDGQITGEVFKVPRANIEELDKLEGTPFLYTRDRIAVNGEEVWIYVFNRPRQHDAIQILSGDWVEFISNSSGLNNN